jgi:hypothetical protein
MRKILPVLACLFYALPARGTEDHFRDVQSALVAWTHEDPAVLEPWAHAIADVCASRRECILFAAQAHVESRFLPWVLDQRCNDPAWREAQRGWVRKSCDAGRAFGPWQVQDDRFRGASPEFQASVALEMMRAHPELWTTSKAAQSHADWWLSKR